VRVAAYYVNATLIGRWRVAVEWWVFA